MKKKVLNISDCELKKNSNQIVFSDGDPGSSIMIIGEGPGQKEDEMGKPFVGDAGLLLNKMLKAININRKNIYITNVVNYRPPNNRKPEVKEISISDFTYYSSDEIGLIPVNTSDLTDLYVTSYYTRILFDPNIINIESVDIVGT